ncbi:MAG: hypothetical protein JRN07_00470 [Nitrososphaerota archaeon]|nr:hypothetical protein [Nitrososphaerota archaeon]
MAVGRAAAVGILLLLVAGAAAVLVVVAPRSSRSAANDTVTAEMVEANGGLTTNGTLTLGQDMLLSVMVPNSTNPVSLHQVFDGHVYATFPWNVTATHYDYILNSNPADPADLGVNTVYAVVTFADGITARSNNVTMNVVQ